MFISSGIICAEPRGRLIVFHAGSLSIPFKEMGEAFTKKYPGVKIQREAAGSRTCARKITDLKRPCDVMASADYTVIQNLLLPGLYQKLKDKCPLRNVSSATCLSWCCLTR